MFVIITVYLYIVTGTYLCEQQEKFKFIYFNKYYPLINIDFTSSKELGFITQ